MTLSLILTCLHCPCPLATLSCGLRPFARPPHKNTASAVLKLTPPPYSSFPRARPSIPCPGWPRLQLLLLCAGHAHATSFFAFAPPFSLAPPLLCSPVHRPSPPSHPGLAHVCPILRAGPGPRWPCPEFPPSVLGRPLTSFASSSFLRLCLQTCLGLGDLFCPAAPQHRPLACLTLPLLSGAPPPWFKLCCPLKLCLSGSQQWDPYTRGLDTELELDLECDRGSGLEGRLQYETCNFRWLWPQVVQSCA